MNENDWHNAINHAEYKGELKGELKGREEGAALKSREIASQMRAEGLSPEIIQKCTGLSMDEIAEL